MNTGLNIKKEVIMSLSVAAVRPLVNVTGNQPISEPQFTGLFKPITNLFRPGEQRAKARALGYFIPTVLEAGLGIAGLVFGINNIENNKVLYGTLSVLSALLIAFPFAIAGGHNWPGYRLAVKHWKQVQHLFSGP